MRYVSLEDIYDAFSFGVTIQLHSPLSAAHISRVAAPAPVYALLMGDGSYDFLDNTGFHSANFVPHTSRQMTIPRR